MKANVSASADKVNQSNSGEAQLAPLLDSSFDDARSDAVVQQKLQSVMHASPRVKQMQTAKTVMDNSPRSSALQHTAAMMAAKPAQRMEKAAVPNNTGLPDNLKSGIEHLSGMSMDQVKVHYNSSQPAQLNAHAFAQGSDIHVAPGQEQHLPHEAWHVVQQAQGRVKPTMQMKGQSLINDDPALETEADVMGQKAVGLQSPAESDSLPKKPVINSSQVIQGYDLKLALIHPITGKSVIMNLHDNVNGIYHYAHQTPELMFSYNLQTNQFFNKDNDPISAAPDFNEDAGPIARSPGSRNQFRSLVFQTDGENRVVSARGPIHRNGTTPETGRSSDSQSGAWDHVQGIHRRMFKPLREFNGGHIIAHHFGGSPGTDNMVPMEKGYNQTGSYKNFENALDFSLAFETPLTIDVSVTYATDFNDLMTQLVINDNGNNVAAINARADLKDIIMRTLGRIPKSITVNSLTNAMGNDIKPGNPDSPMLTLKGTIPTNFSLQSILLNEFKKVGKGRDGDGSSKVFKPFEKSFGPRKKENIDNSKSFHADYQTIYRDMPKPGITNYLPGNNGLAGGVEAYIWIDPMGVFNRHGGSDTIDTVDPLGTNWNYFRKAVGEGNRNKIYKKGHLLNAGLHGPGADSRNLLPITTLANGEMSRNFEEPVKKSEALINPAKGVLWKTQVSGTVITRPNHWDGPTAKLHASENLFNEEAKLPQYLDCFAWEAIQHRGSIERGKLIVSYRVWNNHPGDANGQLGVTRAGIMANDNAIHNKLPANNNNVTGHATVNPLGNKAFASQKGYAMDLNWLNLNLGQLNDFNSGVYERGYDHGFAQAPRDDQTNWQPASIGEYDYGYRKGQERLSYVQGFYTNNYQAPTHQDARLNEKYDDGRYYRGKDIGKNLGNPPQAQPSDPILEGYANGLYARGKEDANSGEVPGHQSNDYLDGYWKAYKNQAFDHGYEFLPVPPALANIDKTEYEKAYSEGQHSRGYDDGYDLEEAQSHQSQDYALGYMDGLFDRGEDDAYGKQPPASQDGDYTNGYQRGADDLSFAEGYDLKILTHTHQQVFSDSYNEGMYKRGDDDGYALKNPPQNAPDVYLKGHKRGISERGNDDGEDLRPRASADQTYLTNYNWGLYVRGERDGLVLMLPASQEQEYLNGFNE